MVRVAVRSIAALGFAFVVSLSSLAIAQGPARGDPHALSQAAKAAFDAGDFETAAKLLELAYANKPWPVLLYNLGRAYQQAGNKPKAVLAYERYLAAQPSSSDAGAVRESIRQLKEQIEREQTLERQAEQEVLERKRAVLDAAREKRAAEEAIELARHKPSAWPWVVTGVGLGAVGAGFVFGSLASSTHAAAVSDPSVTLSESDQSTAKTYALIANVAFVAGGAAAAVGAVWGVFDLRLAITRHAAAAFVPGGVRVEGTF
jgi:tetratricopeptide (TPR) repeat protein